MEREWQQSAGKWWHWTRLLQNTLGDHQRWSMRYIESDILEEDRYHATKQGVIVCLRKPIGTQKPTDYRPITLLNTDYKLLAPKIANCLRPVMEEHIRKSQFCGVPGNTIFEAVATVREAIAQADLRQAPLCLLFLDSQEAFDKISHQYVFTVLKICVLSDWFIDRIKGMHENSTSSF